MLYEHVRGRTPGAVNCFDAPEQPTLALSGQQRQVVAFTCHNLLFGFSSDSAAEHGSQHKDLSKVISNMQRALEYRGRFHDSDENLSEKVPG